MDKQRIITEEEAWLLAEQGLAKQELNRRVSLGEEESVVLLREVIAIHESLSEGMMIEQMPLGLEDKILSKLPGEPLSEAPPLIPPVMLRGLVASFVGLILLFIFLGTSLSTELTVSLPDWWSAAQAQADGVGFGLSSLLKHLSIWMIFLLPGVLFFYGFDRSIARIRIRA